jgi:AcrR family transcriptional regulator
MINETNDKIRSTSFKFFLDKGYEATNIRDICKVVNIKPSSLYFYYKSKQDLFFSIYDDIWNKKIKYLKNLNELKSNISSDGKLKKLFTETIQYHTEYILNEKLLLRYHLFPAEEITALLIDRYKFWVNEENKITINIINECIENNILDNKKNAKDYLHAYNRFVSQHVNEMLIYNIKISLIELDFVWDRFWNSLNN